MLARFLPKELRRGSRANDLEIQLRKRTRAFPPLLLAAKNEKLPLRCVMRATTHRAVAASCSIKARPAVRRMNAATGCRCKGGREGEKVEAEDALSVRWNASRYRIPNRMGENASTWSAHRLNRNTLGARNRERTDGNSSWSLREREAPPRKPFAKIDPLRSSSIGHVANHRLEIGYVFFFLSFIFFTVFLFTRNLTRFVMERRNSVRRQRRNVRRMLARNT